MTDRTRVAILGSTGSIGRQAAEIARAHPELVDVVALVAHRDADGVRRQAAELGAHTTGLGVDAAVEAARRDDVDIVLNAIVGAAGLHASLAALEEGKVLALANKESLVAGGELCLAAAARGGGRIVPVDSEHAAIGLCLEGLERGAVAAIVLTASGGPFRERRDLGSVTREEALAHPTWTMGPKITVDSATLMNKGLEVIEAHHLFGFGYDDVRVVVHPQSIVHGIVELRDGTVLMHAAVADMRLPIRTALLGRAPRPVAGARLDLANADALEFEPLDPSRWRSVALAYAAGRAGLTLPAALNAANEEAVKAFLREEMAFLDIVSVVESVLDAHDPTSAHDVGAVLEADAWARAEARRLIGARAGGDLAGSSTRRV
jgi:1-deoxy-D-xylulose-5-phosphate reductoisomerase